MPAEPGKRARSSRACVDLLALEVCVDRDVDRTLAGTIPAAPSPVAEPPPQPAARGSTQSATSRPRTSRRFIGSQSSHPDCPDRAPRQPRRTKSMTTGTPAERELARGSCSRPSSRSRGSGGRGRSRRPETGAAAPPPASRREDSDAGRSSSDRAAPRGARRRNRFSCAVAIRAVCFSNSSSIRSRSLPTPRLVCAETATSGGRWRRRSTSRGRTSSIPTAAMSHFERTTSVEHPAVRATSATARS